jgi:catechol 2,3-dioxygenase-like lactoylglutathione lyase family enzyme
MTAHVSLITLGVADVARATAFYEALGFKLSKRASQPEVSFFQTGPSCSRCRDATRRRKTQTPKPCGPEMAVLSSPRTLAAKMTSTPSWPERRPLGLVF